MFCELNYVIKSLSKFLKSKLIFMMYGYRFKMYSVVRKFNFKSIIFAREIFIKQLLNNKKNRK